LEFSYIIYITETDFWQHFFDGKYYEEIFSFTDLSISSSASFAC
jgi:hypothetical protein